MKKELSHGKKLGLASFIIFEIIICLLTIEQGLNLFFGSKNLDNNIVNGILFAQGTVFTIVWGTKATANFAKKDTAGGNQN